MFKQERLHIVVYILYLVADMGCLGLSLAIPYMVRWNLLFHAKLATHHFFGKGIYLPSFEQYLRLYIFWTIITLFFLHNQNLYKTNRLISIFKETTLIVKAVLYSTLVVGLVVFFIKAINISRWAFIGNFIFISITLSLWRAIKRLILRRFVIKGYNNFNVLIIGAEKIAKDLIEEIKKNPYLGLKIIGLLDDRREKGTLIEGCEVLGKTVDFEKIILQYFVDEVLITVPEDKYKLAQLAKKGKELKVGLKLIPDPFEENIDVLNIYRIGHLAILDYSIKGLHGADLLGKRTLDIIISVLGIILFAPLLIALSIIIKLSEGGPVLYISQRYGKKGKLFMLYKFRSMIINADSIIDNLQQINEKEWPIFKLKNDPRVNRIGKFLRKYSLDELPQFWNVLKGDMSIVGPRPLPLGQVETQDLNQLKRLTIKPGITGLWQIKGRSDTTFHQLVKWDNWYINNWSLWLDLDIILKTIPAVIKSKGAY